ncbi:hypothetical protein GIB67_006621, partial [Kingdonia uniflora]
HFGHSAKTPITEKNEEPTTPSRDWNSYDSFSWIISEIVFMQNAKVVSERLLAHGFEYVVVDYLWYRRKGTAYEDSSRQWRAKDIGFKNRTCAWMSQGFMSVDTKSGAGRAFLRSLYQQYAEWGVDFVKNDCVFGDDLDVNEINIVSEVKINPPDFAAANMIGANGLKGKSWPDLDMLPWVGSLIQVQSNEGPHRKCNLTLNEQRTQMTLWSIAKSPLIYGEDLRQLDQSTYNLITHPILLEINSFSTHNMEFPYITGEKDNRSGNRALSVPSRNSDKLGKSNAYVGLSSCKDHGSTRWVIEALDQEHERICWKDNLGSKYEPLFCLHRRKSLLISDEEMIHKQQYDGKLHLLSTDDKELCLDAFPRKKLTSGEMKIYSFFPCRWKANQVTYFSCHIQDMLSYDLNR